MILTLVSRSRFPLGAGPASAAVRQRWRDGRRLFWRSGKCGAAGRLIFQEAERLLIAAIAPARSSWKNGFASFGRFLPAPSGSSE